MTKEKKKDKPKGEFLIIKNPKDLPPKEFHNMFSWLMKFQYDIDVKDKLTEKIIEKEEKVKS